MTKVIAIAALVALAPVACSTGPAGGTPGTSDTFKITAPAQPTVVKKGETGVIELTFKAESGFAKRKISLRAEHPAGVSTSLKPTSIELAAGQEAKVQLEVKAGKEAVAGEIAVQVTGTPVGAAAATLPVKVKVE